DTSLNGAKIWITSDGKVGYDAATLSAAFRLQLQGLQAGQSLTDTFTYAIRLASGTLSWATVTLQFGGVNDAVAFSATAQSATVHEIPDNAAGENTANDTAGGTISYTDADNGDTHTATFTPEGGGYLGTFSLDTKNIDKGHGGSVDWSFSVNDKAIDYLADGEHLVQKYDVTIDDGHGGAQTEVVTVELVGVNDGPTVTSADGSADVTEDATTPTLSDAGSIAF